MKFTTILREVPDDRIAYTKAVSYRLKNPGLERWRSDLWYMDDTALEFARYTPTTGHRPESENEIIADTKTLDALGVPAQIGETVSLTYEVKGSHIPLISPSAAFGKRTA